MNKEKKKLAFSLLITGIALFATTENHAMIGRFFGSVSRFAKNTLGFIPNVDFNQTIKAIENNCSQCYFETRTTIENSNSLSSETIQKLMGDLKYDYNDKCIGHQHNLAQKLVAKREEYNGQLPDCCYKNCERNCFNASYGTPIHIPNTGWFPEYVKEYADWLQENDESDDL